MIEFEILSNSAPTLVIFFQIGLCEAEGYKKGFILDGYREDQIEFREKPSIK